MKEEIRKNNLEIEQLKSSSRIYANQAIGLSQEENLREDIEALNRQNENLKKQIEDVLSENNRINTNHQREV